MAYRIGSVGGISSIHYLCAGSLISERYVLSSAHCINDLLVSVRLGAHNLSQSDGEPNAKNYYIKNRIIHEQFNAQSIINDIALIELTVAVLKTGKKKSQINGNLTITNYKSPLDFISIICLPNDKHFVEENFVGRFAFIAGWGATRHLGNTSITLKHTQVPIIDIKSCEMSYRAYFNTIQFNEKVNILQKIHLKFINLLLY